jgi:phage gp37-like protein
MTYNQIIRRIRTIATEHLQVKTFARGLITDFLNDKATNYPAVFLQSNGGKISTSGHQSTVNFRMFIIDMVHVSEDAKENELDVHSDMISIAMDIIAQMNNGVYNDWKISTDNGFQLLVEEKEDMYAGIYIDFSISFLYSQNVCAVPTTKTTYQTTD